MTNEEKAKKIVLSKPFNTASSQDYAYKCAMEMAKWKDEEYEKLIRKQAIKIKLLQAVVKANNITIRMMINK